MKCPNCQKEVKPNKNRTRRHCSAYCRLKTFYKENPRAKQITPAKFTKIWEKVKSAK